MSRRGMEIIFHIHVLKITTMNIFYLLTGDKFILDLFWIYSSTFYFNCLSEETLNRQWRHDLWPHPADAKNKMVACPQGVLLFCFLPSMLFDVCLSLLLHSVQFSWAAAAVRFHRFGVKTHWTQFTRKFRTTRIRGSAPQTGSDVRKFEPICWANTDSSRKPRPRLSACCRTEARLQKNRANPFALCGPAFQPRQQVRPA